MSGKVIWTIREVVDLMQARVKNHFDSNIIVTGSTGLGKSSLINKILLRCEGFNQWKQQVYIRSDIIKLLSEQKQSFCWADELISSAFKRTHYDTEQIDLIETLTQYRCNENIFCGALPVFFTLDKELMKLFAINIDVIRRGVAVIHMRREGRRYTDDPWDVKINAKMEEDWSRKAQRDINFKIPYHKYTTFVGYLYFEPLTEIQEKLYQEIRDFKKREVRDAKEPENVGGFYDRILDLALKKQLTEETLKGVCLVNGKDLVSVRTRINQLLKSKGEKDRLNDLLVKPHLEKSTNKAILDELKDI